MAKYFTFKALVHSDTAKAKGIENIPNWEQIWCLERLSMFLDSIREECGFSIKVNSAYRSEPLNKAVGGTGTSAHLKGLAADILPYTPTTDRFNKLETVLRSRLKDADQIIAYRKRHFFHVGISNGTPRGQWLEKE